MPTHAELMRGFTLGPWRVLPERGLLIRDDDERHVEPLVMDVFVVLASHGGDVVTKDQLIQEVWHGRPQTDDVITRCISVLRRALDDDAKSPQYIETLQKRGYRVMQPAMVETAAEKPPPPKPLSTRPDFMLVGVAFVAIIVIALIAIWLPKPLPGGLPEEEAVAVYSFECLLPPGDDRLYLCFGFEDEIIRQLKTIENLVVIRMRDATERPPEDVDGIVTGSVQIIGNDLRVRARFEEPLTQETRAQIALTGQSDDIFDTQNELAAGIIAQMYGERIALVASPVTPTSYAAEEAYIQGRFQFEKRTRDATLKAIEHFEEAIRLKPDYGAAWLGLAYTYIIWPDYDIGVDRDAVYGMALDAARKGIEADPSIREAAGTVIGFVYHKQQRWFEAVAAFETAIDAESVQPIAHHWYSYGLASVGRLEDAVVQATRALRLDPRSPDLAVIASRVAITNLWLNDMERAGYYFDMVSNLGQETPMHLLAYALYLHRSDRHQEAKLLVARALQGAGLPAEWVGPVLDGTDDPAKREQAVAMFEQVAGSGQMMENLKVALWVMLGETDRAMQVTRQLEHAPGLFELELIYIDEFKPLREHPEFSTFTAAIGLDRYWRDTGCTWIADRISCREQGD